MRRMVIERSMHPQYLSNTYLVGETGGAGFFVDAGGPVNALIHAAERHEMTPTHVLLTHRQHDHVAELAKLTERWPQMAVLAHPDERVDGVTGELAPDETVRVGDLEVRALHTPGHTKGMLSLLVEGNVFTGDTLFKGSVGGVRAPGHTTYEDLKRSIMDVLLALPPDTVILPGHTDSTTVGDEYERNAFERRQVEAAEQIVAALGTMKGAAMKLGQVMSFLDVGLVPEEYREDFQRKLAALRDAAPQVSFKDMRKVVEQDLGGK